MVHLTSFALSASLAKSPRGATARDDILVVPTSSFRIFRSTFCRYEHIRRDSRPSRFPHAHACSPHDSALAPDVERRRDDSECVTSSPCGFSASLRRCCSTRLSQTHLRVSRSSSFLTPLPVRMWRYSIRSAQSRRPHSCPDDERAFVARAPRAVWLQGKPGYGSRGDGDVVDRLAALPQGQHHAIALELLEHGAELALEMRRVERPEAVQARGHLRAQ